MIDERNWKFISIKHYSSNNLVIPHIPHSHWFGDCFLASSFGLVGITTAAIQPRQVVHMCSNLQKSSHQTDANEAKRHDVLYGREMHAGKKKY